MSHGVAATAGHLSSNGGIRGHSAGEHFPFIVVGTGDDKWYVQAPDGTQSMRVDTAAMAVNMALFAKHSWGGV